MLNSQKAEEIQNAIMKVTSTSSLIKKNPNKSLTENTSANISKFMVINENTRNHAVSRDKSNKPKMNSFNISVGKKGKDNKVLKTQGDSAKESHINTVKNNINEDIKEEEEEQLKEKLKEKLKEHIKEKESIKEMVKNSIKEEIKKEITKENTKPAEKKSKSIEKEKKASEKTSTANSNINTITNIKKVEKEEDNVKIIFTKEVICHEVLNLEDKIGQRYFDVSKNENVQIPSEYINIIYYNLLLEESKGIDPKPVYGYMKNQKEVNEQMRSILIDWLIDVHLKFEFVDETLFMTILIIDRYLSKLEITRSRLQLLGIVSLMIACKHEEIDLPKVDDFIYITDNAYTREEVFSMENEVLKLLNFNLLYPSPIKFYELLAFGFGFNKKQLMMGKYLMESFLLDMKYIKYKASVIACASAYIVMKFFKFENYFESYNKKYFALDDENCGEHVIKECAKDICLYVDNISKTNFKSTQNKFSSPAYEKVALLVLGKS